MTGQPEPGFILQLDAFVAVLANLRDLVEPIGQARRILERAANEDKIILTCGNGGSAADAEHIVAELLGYFKVKNRPPINAVCLNSNVAFMTAWSNDVAFDDIFGRQVEAFGKAGALICITTSGWSRNAIFAAIKAREEGTPVIVLMGTPLGRPAPIEMHADVCIKVPTHDTALVQQAHQVIYHYLCGALE